MRTLSEMRTRLRRYIVDTDSSTYANSDLDTIMQIAAKNLWGIFMGDSRGKSILRRYQAPQVQVANWDEYPVPSDALLLEGLEYRQYTTFYCSLTTGTVSETNPANWKLVTDGSFSIRLDDRYYDISGVDFSSITGAGGSMSEVATVLQTAIRAATGGTETVTWSGTGSTFTFSSYDRTGYLETHPYATDQSWTDLSSSSWCNGQRGTATPAITTGAPDWEPVMYGFEDPDRIAPNDSYTLARTNLKQSSIEGWHEIDESWIRVWPPVVSSAGILRLRYLITPTFPTETYEKFLHLPDGVDTLVEYMGSVLAGLEKVEDDGALLGMNVFGSAFESRLENFYQGIGGGVVRQKRHVWVVDE